MKKNAARGYAILGILLVLFSVIAFAVPFAKTVMFWIAFCFGVLAIAFQVYVFNISFTGGETARSRFYGFPIARVGVYYLVGQLIVSIIEMIVAAIVPVWIPLIVNILLFALAAIGCIAVETMRDEIIRQDVQLKKDVSNMRELQSLSATMVNQCTDEGLKVTFAKIADEFRYSDPVTSEKTRSLEEEMRIQMGNIQQALVDGDFDGAKALCGKLMGSLAERNRICSVSK